MSNSAVASLFTMSIETNDPALQNLDVVNVSFNDNDTVFTVAESYSFFRVASTDDTVTFSNESL